MRAFQPASTHVSVPSRIAEIPFPSARPHGLMTSVLGERAALANPSDNSKEGTVNIEDGLARFVVQLEADGRSSHTISQYRRHVRLFASWARDVGHGGVLRGIDHEDIATFLTSTQANTRPDGGLKTAGSMNALRGSVKGFFRYLHQAGHVSQDPSRLVRRAVCGRAPPETLSTNDLDRLLFVLANADGLDGRRDSALFHLMMRAGLRVGSVVALDVEDVDLDRAELRLRSTKGDRPERVFLATALRDHLRRYIDERTTGPLFVGQNGDRLTTRHVQRRLDHWLRKAGVDHSASPHTLRHSFAQGLYQKTGDIFLVKEALRHRSITSTMVYMRPDEDRLRAALG